jgi:hypothetical protein
LRTISAAIGAILGARKACITSLSGLVLRVGYQ